MNFYLGFFKDKQQKNALGNPFNRKIAREKTFSWNFNANFRKSFPARNVIKIHLREIIMI